VRARRWQQDNFQQLTQHVHDYMFELVSAMVAAEPHQI
jgi:hypothetical protein